MRIFETKTAIRAWSRNARKCGQTIAFIPTMGYLHDGHLALIRKGHGCADRVVASIFVNPTQFGDDEDFARYPSDIESDLAKLRTLKVDALFMPSSDEMYGDGSDTLVDAPQLSSILQGAVRPGHFRGVATVVSKLFHIVEPDYAIFGEKDYQQLTLIRQMVNDLDFCVDIIGHETIREPDGLAMSSRNVRLTNEDRKAATILNQSLDEAENQARAGGSLSKVLEAIKTQLETEPRAKPHSVEVRSATSLAPLPATYKGKAVILLSVSFGDVLLIDQRVIHLV